MYIFAHSMDISSSPVMASKEHEEVSEDLALQREPSIKKRKRAYELDDIGRGRGPLGTLSANYLYHSSLPTPTPSTSSFFSDNNPHSAVAIPLARMNSTGSSFPVSKRFQLSPTSRTAPMRPLPARSHTDSKPIIHAPNLHPCHLCHRRPTTVQDLPAYSDCESCQLRTCYICMRTCEGPRCHLQKPSHCTSMPDVTEADKGRNVCGKCCIEVGVEGRVWCLVCYEDDAEEEEGYSHCRIKKEMQSVRIDRVADWLQGCEEEDDQRLG